MRNKNTKYWGLQAYLPAHSPGEGKCLNSLRTAENSKGLGWRALLRYIFFNAWMTGRRNKWLLALAINPSATPFENWKWVKSLQLHTFATIPSLLPDAHLLSLTAVDVETVLPTDKTHLPKSPSQISALPFLEIEWVSVFFKESVKDFLPQSSTRKSHLGLGLKPEPHFHWEAWLLRFMGVLHRTYWWNLHLLLYDVSLYIGSSVKKRKIRLSQQVGLEFSLKSPEICRVVWTLTLVNISLHSKAIMTNWMQLQEVIWETPVVEVIESSGLWGRSLARWLNDLLTPREGVTHRASQSSLAGQQWRALAAESSYFNVYNNRAKKNSKSVKTDLIRLFLLYRSSWNRVLASFFFNNQTL